MCCGSSICGGGVEEGIRQRRERSGTGRRLRGGEGERKGSHSNEKGDMKEREERIIMKYKRKVK